MRLLHMSVFFRALRDEAPESIRRHHLVGVLISDSYSIQLLVQLRSIAVHCKNSSNVASTYYLIIIWLVTQFPYSTNYIQMIS
jgi:hypothetical protein